MTGIAALVVEIRQAIEKAAGGRAPAPDRKFNKDDEFVAHGLNVPAWRAIMREFRPRFRALSLEERLELAEALLTEGEGWLGHSGIYVLALSVDALGPQHYEQLDRMAERFTGWSHVDDVCIAVVQPLLRSHRAETLALLERWNRSANRWKRRASVVAFVRKVGESGEFTEEALRLCENLLRDPEDLVRKGVGWALKDVMRGDRERVLAYVQDLRRRGVSATITLYAIRDLKGAQRAELLATRGAE
ncbi:MAG TPA: DNA alkylation repair protein [Dehalococcoidia bacterium]|nr:DNA alkylation repair protein [Dehalococcoidia bacterium]